MKIFRVIEPSVRFNLLVLFVAGFLFWSSLTSLLPTLSLYLKDMGTSKHQIGIIMGAFAIGLLIFRPWLGQLADQRGRRLVLLIGLGVATTAPLGYLFTQSIPLLIGIRIFHGISIAAFSTAYSALVVDLSPPKNRGEIIGYMSLVSPIGMAIGPALGGFIQAWAGYTPLFLLASGLGCVGLLGGLAVRSLPVQITQPSSRSIEPFWQILSSPRLRIPTVLLLLIGLAFGTLSTFLPLFMQETGVTLNAGLFYTAAALASFMIRLPIGRASDRYGRGRFITLGLALYTTAMLLLWEADRNGMFLLAGVLEGSGIGMFIPMVMALLADRSRPDERGRVFGLCMAGFDLGIAIAGPTLGLVADVIGYRGLFGVASSLVFIGLLLFISQSSHSLSASFAFAFRNGRDLYAFARSPEEAAG